MANTSFSIYIAKRIMKQLLICILLVASALQMQAQIKAFPLQENKEIKQYHKTHPDYQWNSSHKLTKKAKDDTLELPFFEDFILDHIYPDSSKWMENMVYVNREFGIRPPSYGVATFDQLDHEGNPYLSLHNTDIDAGDTLTSLRINMTDMGGHQLVPKDSIYLSFFYQGKGRGQQILSTDELELSFKDTGGHWIEVWSKTGVSQTEFEQVMIPISSVAYFHDAFQFRFNNITHRWGNNNQWHIDYIQLDTGRRANDLYNRDVTIQSEPSSMLKNYSVLPYQHFLADEANEKHNSTHLRLSNRSNLLKQVSIKYRETVDGNQVGAIDNFTNIDNVLAYDDTNRIVDLYDFGNLTGNEFTIERTYICKEDSQESIRKFQFNDTVVAQQVFANYYARDDGSAEAGFGFDNLIGREGSIAVRFDMKMRDTLQGVGFYFTQINHDVSDKRFTIKVWRSIAVNGAKDSLLFETFQSRPTYTNKLNGFAFFALDSPLVLDPGEFYVGWTQDQDYSLNVGLDQNHGRILGRDQSANAEIYYHIGAGWIQNTNKALYGSPMIRAYVGEYSDPTAGIKKPKADAINTKVYVYPNPSSGVFTLSSPEAQFVQVYDLRGQLLSEFEVENRKIDLSELRNGRYLLRWTNADRSRSGATWLQIAHH